MQEGMENEMSLSDVQRDALQELANIGAGHASTVLSEMVHREIKMGVPKVEVLPLERLMDFAKDEKVVIGILLKISGSLQMYILLLIPRSSAFSLANLLMTEPQAPTDRILSEMDQSALQEVSNVMICAFFDSISELLNIPIVPGPPMLAYDVPGAVIDYVLVQIGAVASRVVVFNVDLREESRGNFHIDMFLLPLPSSVDLILTKLGVKETP